MVKPPMTDVECRIEALEQALLLIAKELDGGDALRLSVVVKTLEGRSKDILSGNPRNALGQAYASVAALLKG